MISVERRGRHAVYRIADDRLPPLLDALAEFAGGPLPTPSPEVPADGDRLAYGPNAAAGLAEWGIDISTVDPGRRAPAAQCLDRTVRRRPHLGDALLESAGRNGWVPDGPR